MITDDAPGLALWCRQTVAHGTTFSPFAMAYDNGKAIALCRDVTPSLAKLWPRIRRMN